MSDRRPTGLRRRWVVAQIAVKAVIIRRLIRSRTFLSLLRRGLLRSNATRQRWITRHDELVGVLEQPDVFGMPYMKRMQRLGTPFILGRDPSDDDYRRQRDALDAAFLDIDLKRLRQQTRDLAETEIGGALGEIDILEGLTDIVLARTAAGALWGESLTAAQTAQARAVARDIFVNPLDDPNVRERAEVAAPKLLRHAWDLVERRHEAPNSEPEDVLDRLLAARLSDQEVVENMLGVLVAWLTSVSRTVGCAFDELLRREWSEQRGWAHAAARNGDLDTVADVLFEALRFRPSMPGLERVCRHDARVGPRSLPRGKGLLLVMTGAMLDPRRVTAPLEFRPGRPDAEYLHFGRGAHRCVGETVARIQVAEIGAAVLRRPNLRRRSKMEMDGPYPKRLRVRFDATVE